MSDIDNDLKQTNKNNIDTKELMALERTTTALIGTSISFILLGFVVEKFELFLHIIAAELKGKNSPSLPQLKHIVFYNYMGMLIVGAGIVLAAYTYRYYTNWIEHLEKKEIDVDKKIYFFLSFFVAIVGIILLASMIIIK